MPFGLGVHHAAIDPDGGEGATLASDPTIPRDTFAWREGQVRWVAAE
jgi:hypothetical protein